MAPRDLTVLVVDDEDEVRSALRAILHHEGMRTLEAATAEGALRLIRTATPDVLLLDIRLPDGDGREVLREARQLAPDMPVIILTGYSSIQDAVERVKDGAFWYLAKPCGQAELLAAVGGALREVARRRRQREPLGEQLSLLETMGGSEAIVALSRDVARVAPTEFSVVIVGETGTGKELVARAIHLQSRRGAAGFVAVDSGAIPETLIENELFGHERGAFTGADRTRPGKFELAAGGTLFLDESGNLPMGMQGKLLRVLQERRCYRVGGSAPIAVDVRVIAASNQPLAVSPAGSGFRTDLYHRLTEYLIQVPALRERREDITHLAERFRRATSEELGKTVAGFTPAALDLLAGHDWPGNVRELRNVVRRAVLLADGIIDARHLPALRTDTEYPPPAGVRATRLGTLSLRQILHQEIELIERALIRQALERSHGNKAEAARLLRVDYKTLHGKVKLYGIKMP